MNMNKLRSLVFAAFLALPFASSFAQVGISVNWAPPPLPVYEQPLCPVAGYIWTPGYWGWDSYYYDYYWVPGVWVPPPRVGLLWTPGWWGWRNGAYAFNQGYWGPTVGFYGGVNYGFGYTGNGYWGGRWSGNTFQYNTAVTRVNKTVIRNTYVNNSFTRNVNANRTSFNGPNGIKAEPTAEQRNAMANAKKEGPTSQQLARQQAASKDQNLRASVNKGKPNQEAIKSFNKREGADQGEGAQRLGAAGGAAGAGAGNKPGNLPERQGQGAAAGAGAENKAENLAERRGEGATAGAGKTGNEPGNAANRNREGAGAGAGPGKPENNRTDIAEHNRQGAGAGNAGAVKPGANANKLKAENQRNRGNMGGNQAKMHTANAAAARGQHAMNQQKPKQMTGQHRQQQMGGGQYQQQKMAAQRRPQMQGGGNRPPPRGKQQQQQQQQKKKKPNER
jgi:hypothetical protein